MESGGALEVILLLHLNPYTMKGNDPAYVQERGDYYERARGLTSST